MKKKILITGGAGFLSQNLFIYLKDYFKLYLTFNNSKPKISKEFFVKCNLENYLQIKKTVEIIKPDYIINTAGLTDVEKCELNKNKAYNQNVNIIVNLCNLCKKYNIKLIHISTDHIFDGKKSFYSENDKAFPLNRYAKTKFIAEKKIKKYLSNYIIIRSNFFGWDINKSKKFFSWLIDNLNAKKNIKLYSDVFFTPVSSYFLSLVLKKLIKEDFKGLINVSSNERISKYHFGILISKIFLFKKTLIKKIKYKDINIKIKRPLDMSLSNKFLKKKFKIKVPSIKNQLKKIFEQRFEGSFDTINPIIQYGKHHIDNKDIQSVTNIMKNAPIAQSKEIEKFENNIANFVGAKYAVAVSSCSAGMHLACKVLNLNNKNNLITSPISFVSTANSALHCGSKISFADIDKNTLNITSQTISNLTEGNSRNNVFLPVHFGGNPSNTKSIFNSFKRNKIIEDAAHSFGAKYDNGRMVGSCDYSDMTVFSFHPVKTITTAEGGVITTNNNDYYEKLRVLRSHGIVKDKKYFNNRKSHGPWYYEVSSLSNHYRINDLQCALGNSQLEKVEKFVNKRRKLAEFYFAEFSKFKNLRVGQKFNENSSYHLFILRIDFNKIKKTRTEIMKILRARGIGSQVHYIPIPMHPLYKKINNQNINKELPNALKYYKEALSIPIFYDLSYNNQKNIINIFKDIIE